MSSRLITAGGAATALRHVRRASPRATFPRSTPAGRSLCNGPRPTPSTGLAIAGRLRSAGQGGGQGGAHEERTGAAAAAAVAVAAAAATAAAVVVGSVRQEDSALVLAAEAYSIPIGRAYPDVCNCFIEVSRESRMKYEWDEETNMLKLDRVLHGAAFYPHDYGFIPQTLCGDGDPLDVLVLGTSALQPGAIVDIRPLGYMVMEDEKGLDEKVLAVPDKDPRFNHMKSLRDVPEHVLREITNFFETYKQLEKSKWVKVGGWKGSMDTHDLIEQTHKTYLAAKRTQKKDAKK